MPDPNNQPSSRGIVDVIFDLIRRAPAWAIGIVLIILALGYVIHTIEGLKLDNQRLWRYGEAQHQAIDKTAQATTNPTSQPGYVEQFYHPKEGP